MAAAVADPVPASAIEVAGHGVLHVHVKVVPGASRAGLAGSYGDRLKVRVTAAAESGKANKAVLTLLADALQLTRQDVVLVRGQTTPRKTIAVHGVDGPEAARRLGLEPA